MPNILVKIPRDTYTPDACRKLTEGINQAAAIAESIPAKPENRSLCWVTIEEVDPALFTCGGVDMSQRFIPAIAVAYVPAGVLDEARRKIYVETLTSAFQNALPATDARKVVPSIILTDVADGAWGAGGQIWHLADFARKAGFEHLQHHVAD